MCVCAFRFQRAFLSCRDPLLLKVQPRDSIKLRTARQNLIQGQDGDGGLIRDPPQHEGSHGDRPRRGGWCVLMRFHGGLA